MGNGQSRRTATDTDTRGAGMNGRADVRSVTEMEDVPEAIRMINRKTDRINDETREDRNYVSARRRITLGAEITAWINKKIPE